ncbi:MAG: T9SS type A sorting domain-containing protein [Saprospiraceae bacterium]
MGTRNWSNISIDPRNTKTLQVVNNPIAVPGDVSAGDYYVGVIINISDADNGNNNTVYYDTYPVTVTCNTPGSPTVSASGSTNLCPGQNVTLTASNVCSGCTVKWSNGQTGTSITVSSSGTYKAKNENGCGKISSYSNSISVSSASLPTAPTISANGSLMLCNGQSVSLTATNVCSGCSVNWSNGQSGTSITVSTQGNFTASYTNSCGQGPESNTISTTIGSAPSAPSISATGPTSLCNGQSVTLNATNVCNGCTVNWSDGQSGTSITVSNPGNYTATNTSSCGTSKPSLSISIALGTVPVAPVLSAEGGNQQLCPGQSLELQASNVCTDCDIVWSTGQTTESITITSQGVFTAVAQNSCGVSNTSNSLTIIPGVAPSTPVIIAEGSTTLCNNQSVAITASNVCPACTVNWSNGQSGSTLSASSPGVYTATYTNSCGTSNASNSIEVITGGQFIPEIQVNNICYLAAPNGSAYQWYLNGAAIAGATNQFYIAVNSGYYVMSMTSLGGCQGVSDPVFAQACLSSTREELWEVDIKLFPNPASENLHIQLTNGVSISNFSFELIEPDGRIATTMQKTNMLNTEIVQISIGHLPVGIYFYRIRSDQGMLTGKVMIEH